MEVRSYVRNPCKLACIFAWISLYDTGPLTGKFFTERTNRCFSLSFIHFFLLLFQIGRQPGPDDSLWDPSHRDVPDPVLPRAGGVGLRVGSHGAQHGGYRLSRQPTDDTDLWGKCATISTGKGDMNPE